MMLQDYDFLGKSSTGSGLNCWAGDCHGGRVWAISMHRLLSFIILIKFIIKDNIVDIYLS